MAICVSYTKEDRESLDRFMVRMYQARGMVYDPEGIHSDIARAEEVYGRKGGDFWLLRDSSGDLMGSVGLRIWEESLRIGEIKRLFILPEHQGKGYGRLLMELVLAYAREHRFRRIVLDTMKEAERARALYVKLGFQEIPRYNDNMRAEYFYELRLE